MSKTKKDIQVLKTEISQQRYENAHLKTKISRLEDQITRIEFQSRRDNLLIDGLDESKTENYTQKVRKMFKQDMKLDDVDNIQVVRCHQLQNKRKGQTSMTIIVKFQWFGDHMRVWQAKWNLKGKNIYLNEDFPKAIMDKCYILQPMVKRARNNEMKAFLIDGTKYTIDDLTKLLSELDPAKIATKDVTDNMLVFFGGQSPLSNFHKSKFVLNVSTYDCNERYYVCGKAEFANDGRALEAVMRAESPSECKIRR